MAITISGISGKIELYRSPETSLYGIRIHDREGRHVYFELDKKYAKEWVNALSNKTTDIPEYIIQPFRAVATVTYVEGQYRVSSYDLIDPKRIINASFSAEQAEEVITGLESYLKSGKFN